LYVVTLYILVYIACIGYVSYGVLLGISFHLFRADITDNVHLAPLLGHYKEDLLNFVFKHLQFLFVTSIWEWRKYLIHFSTNPILFATCTSTFSKFHKNMHNDVLKSTQ
jgi:hypothetical protein